MAKKRKAPKPVQLRMYKWEGSWGPFTITLPCGECALTEDVIKATLENELGHVPVEFVKKPWLTYWWEPLVSGGWHAPIILVGNKVIAQGDALNRGLLTEMVIRAYAKTHPIEGNKVFANPIVRTASKRRNCSTKPVSSMSISTSLRTRRRCMRCWFG